MAGWFLVTPDPGSLALLPETWFRDCFHQTSLQLGVKLDLQPPLMSLSKSGNDLCHSGDLYSVIQIVFVLTFRLPPFHLDYLSRRSDYICPAILIVSIAVIHILFLNIHIVSIFSYR